MYWLAVIVAFASMRYFEKTGHWPLMKPKAKDVDDDALDRSSSDGGNGVLDDSREMKAIDQGAAASSTVREIPA